MKVQEALPDHFKTCPKCGAEIYPTLALCLSCGTQPWRQPESDAGPKRDLTPPIGGAIKSLLWFLLLLMSAFVLYFILK